ncbi:MAG TPA: hypothetical protein VIE39_04605, partial [Thermoanaerobaculia bacterium]
MSTPIREPEKTPLPPIRALFAGHVPEDLIFPFPEISAEERETVDTFLDSLRAFAKDPIDAGRIDREHHIPAEVVRGLA